MLERQLKRLLKLRPKGRPKKKVNKSVSVPLFLLKVEGKEIDLDKGI